MAGISASDGRAGEQRPDVELDAGHDEEHRHQEAIADGAQLALIALLRRPVVAVGDIQHDAADEGAEQGVDPELVREGGEREQHHEGAADAQLRRRLVGGQQRPAQPG